MEPLAATLREVSRTMLHADDPWWIIGSAAVRLHGAETTVADVDLACSVRDARRFCEAMGRTPEVSRGTETFRSEVFERFDQFPVPMEVMGGMRFRYRGEWIEMRPATRVPIEGVYVPARQELMTILTMFGREKDLRRAALLADGGPAS